MTSENSNKLSTLEVLKRGRNLIMYPECWCKHSFAMTKNNIPTSDPFSGGVVKYCIMAAYMKASNNWMPRLHILREALPSSCESVSLTFFNDDPSTTHGDVLALYDRAIEIEASRRSYHE